MSNTEVLYPIKSICYPVGKRGRDPFDTHYISSFFCDEAYHERRRVWHPGEYWNRKRGGDSDLGDKVFSIGDGIIAAKGHWPVWGNILVLKHLLPDARYFWSQYAHLNTMADFSVGEDIARGVEVGTIGKGDKGQFVAHLHFEIRKVELPPNSWDVRDKGRVVANYYNPSRFIEGWKKRLNA